MLTSSGSVVSFLGTVGIGLVLVVGSGCDSVPGQAPEALRPPSVFALQIVPDSVHGSDLDRDGEQEAIPVALSAEAKDPDGEVDRVLFVLQPASTPAETAFGQLEPDDSTQFGYARRLSLAVPRTVAERYTIRVFAVDDDSLASNQVTGQFRFVPEDTSDASRELSSRENGKRISREMGRSSSFVRPFIKGAQDGS